MKWLVAFLTAQMLAALLTMSFVKNNLGDDFYRYEIIGETESRSLDIAAVLQLQLLLSVPIIVVMFLLMGVFLRRTKPRAK